MVRDRLLWRAVALLLAFSFGLVGMGCRKPELFAVDHLAVRGVSAAASPMVTPAESEVESALKKALERNGGFRLSIGSPTKSGLRLEATIAFHASPLGPPPGGNDSESAVLLSIGRGQGDERFEVEGSGPADGPGLERALDEAVSAAYLKLTAPAKGDRELRRDATADGRENRSRREAALDELVRRRRPAAEPLLLERLKSGDPVGVRRAIGGLVELRQSSAVPALIELAHGQEEMFLRELIFALGAIGGDEARAYLFTVAQGHDEPEIRAAAGEALHELGEKETRK